MKKRYKSYLKVNFVTLIFIVISFISITFAWFAYSGLASVETDVNVKAWYIELEKDGDKVSNEVVISLDDIYPGMETVNEKINIKNLGDSDAEVKYTISSARVLSDEKDNYVISELVTSESVLDKLSHDYPFHINISLSEGYLKSKTGESMFEVSISWPLDSGNDVLDSSWGTKAYEFQKNEKELKKQDSSYQLKSSIKIVINVSAEQYLENDNSLDTNYLLGSQVLYNPVLNQKCSSIGDGCIKTYVIDPSNKIGDTTVTLMPDPLNTFATGDYSNYSTLYTSITKNWTVEHRALLIDDLLKVVSNDIVNSFIIKPKYSNSIMGDLKVASRISSLNSSTIALGGYYSFSNEKFNYLIANNCYWTSSIYDLTHAFAFQKIDDNNSKIFGENKTADCKIIPVIVAKKTK